MSNYNTDTIETSNYKKVTYWKNLKFGESTRSRIRYVLNRVYKSWLLSFDLDSKIDWRYKNTNNEQIKYTNNDPYTIPLIQRPIYTIEIIWPEIYEDGYVYTNEEGKLHNTHGPARVFTSGVNKGKQQWFENGEYIKGDTLQRVTNRYQLASNYLDVTDWNDNELN